ncbi:MAG: hypothetical protein ABGY09_04535 [Euryarchaeota archaeon]
MGAVGAVVLAALAVGDPDAGLLVGAASTLAHELGHALVAAGYHGGVRAWWVQPGLPPRLMLETRDGRWIEIRYEPPDAFVTVGPYPAGTSEEVLRGWMVESGWRYALDPRRVVSEVGYRDADEALSGPVVGALTAAALAPLDPHAAFDAALLNVMNLLPEEVAGSLLDGWYALSAVVNGRYPVDRYLLEVGLALLAASVTAAEDPESGVLLREVAVGTLALAPVRLLLDVSKLALAGVLGLEVRLRGPYAFPGVGVGLNLSVVGPPRWREALGPAAAALWLAVLPFVPQPWRGLLGLELAMDAIADTDPVYPSLGSFLGRELGLAMAAAFLVVGGLPLSLLPGLVGL